MNLKELSFEKQVKYLGAFMNVEDSFLRAYMALFAFRHHLIDRQHQGISLKPVVRWYLGQLAKAYITNQFRPARESLDKMAEIGLVVAIGDREKPNFVEYRLDDALFPALQNVLEGIFTKEFVDSVVAGVKFYRPPGQGKRRMEYEGRSGEGLEQPDG